MEMPMQGPPQGMQPQPMQQPGMPMQPGQQPQMGQVAVVQQVLVRREWAEMTRLEYDSQDIMDQEWHVIKEFPTPAFLLGMNRLDLDMEWKGNPDSAVKLAWIREGVDIMEIEPFNGAFPEYVEMKSVIGNDFNGFLSAWQPGDRIAIMCRVGLGEHRLKIRRLNASLAGHYNGPPPRPKNTVIIIQ